MTHEITDEHINTVFRSIVLRLNRIEKRLDALELHRKRVAKLNEIQARHAEEDLERDSPEVRAEVKRRVDAIRKELNEWQE